MVAIKIKLSTCTQMKVLKKLVLSLPIVVLLAGCGKPASTVTEVAQTLEVGCASCLYDMDGVEGCVTAVKVADTSYLLEGAELDAHNNGLCATTKQAKVVGVIQNGAFLASSIELTASE